MAATRLIHPYFICWIGTAAATILFGTSSMATAGTMPSWSRMLMPAPGNSFARKSRIIALLLLHRHSTVLIEDAPQLGGNIGRVAVFDVAALQHVDQFAFPEKRNRGGRGGISDKVGSGTFCGVHILAGKNCKCSIGPGTTLHGSSNCRTHAAGSASADGIHDHHGGPLLSAQLVINFGGGFQFLNAQAG